MPMTYPNRKLPSRKHPLLKKLPRKLKLTTQWLKATTATTATMATLQKKATTTPKPWPLTEEEKATAEAKKLADALDVLLLGAWTF